MGVVFQEPSGSLAQGEDLDKHLSILTVDSVPSHVAPAQDSRKYSTEGNCNDSSTAPGAS